MRGIDVALLKEIVRLESPHPWLNLLEIHVPDLPAPIRLVRNTEDIVWQGNTYSRFPFEVDTLKEGGNSGIPQMTLRVSNVVLALQPYVESARGLVDCLVTIHRVNAGYLSSDTSELSATLQVTDCSSDENWITWTLGVPNPLRLSAPQWVYYSDLCNFPFKGAECGYAGQSGTVSVASQASAVTGTGTKFSLLSAGDTVDIGGIACVVDHILSDTSLVLVSPHVPGAAGAKLFLSQCARHLTDCRKRENADWFGGYPSVGKGGVRV